MKILQVATAAQVPFCSLSARMVQTGGLTGETRSAAESLRLRMDGTASLANREIGRVLPANYRKMPFSGAAEDANRAAAADYLDGLRGDPSETRTR
jgi:hypothetical protein